MASAGILPADIHGGAMIMRQIIKPCVISLALSGVLHLTGCSSSGSTYDSVNYNVYSGYGYPYYGYGGYYYYDDDDHHHHDDDDHRPDRPDRPNRPDRPIRPDRPSTQPVNRPGGGMTRPAGGMGRPSGGMMRGGGGGRRGGGGGRRR